MAKAKLARRGRPPLAETEGKRSVLNARVTRETRQRLQEAAANSGRSLSQEIEFRLERTFAQDDARYEDFGGEIHHRFFRVLADTGQIIGDQSGRDWFEDGEAYDQWIAAVALLLGQFRPTRVIGVGVPAGETAGFEKGLKSLGPRAAAKALRLWADELDGTTDAKSRRAGVRDAFLTVTEAAGRSRNR